MKAALLLALAAGIAAAGCDDPAPAVVTPAAPGGPGAPAAAQPAAAPKPRRKLPVFVDVAKEAGLTAMNHTGKPALKDWIVSGMGGGSMALDYDQDGDMDLVVVDGTMLSEAGDLEYHDDWRTRLYRNDGQMRFTDVTKAAGIDIKAFGFGGATCDFDADGFPDFYVCCWGVNFLMRNRGDGTFEDVTAKAGVAGGADDMSTSCAWGDVNGDGVNDLYVANYSDQRAFIEYCREKGLPGRHANWRGMAVYYGPGGLVGQVDRLYFGNPDGTFREVTEASLGHQNRGLTDPGRYGFQPIMTDVDNDGDLDIFVANDTQENYLWVNDGKGTFKDQGVETAAAVDADAKAQAGMGVDAADVNRDGWIDLVMTAFSHDHNTIRINQTAKTKVVSFRDMSNAYNLTRPSYLRLSWGARMWDYDNDGELDLFIACGHVYGEIDNFEKTTNSSYRQRCLHMHNVGPPTYAWEDVTDDGGPALQLKRVWRGACFADFDDDGDLDVFVSALNDVPALMRNDGGDANAYLRFRLVGKGKMRDPAGARVTVFLADGKPRMEELHHGASFCNDNDPRLFFGLGAETTAKKVLVRWPGGETQSFDDVAGRKFYVIEQGKAELREDKR